MVHTPIHASWLNQVEIYFSVLQRKALTPNDFESLNDLQSRLLEFQQHYTAIAKPFQWKFTRSDLEKLLARLDNDELLGASARCFKSSRTSPSCAKHSASGTLA